MSGDDNNESTGADPSPFIARWRSSGAAERANYQLFLSELCDVLDVPRPDPTGPDPAQDAYVFERAVTFHHGDGSTSTGRIDLYKRGCFVLEAKQGSDHQSTAEPPLVPKPRGRTGTAVRGTRRWDDAMLRARGQAESYAKALPSEEGWPPFLVLADVGHCIELYADFSGTGKNYSQFPDARSFRIALADLAEAGVRDRLRLVWSDPASLDPARRTARVTREIADRLARLARSLEKAGHAPESVATFLMRCLFTMFAEDVELIPKGAFAGLLQSLVGDAAKFHPMAKELWRAMNRGGFSTVLREDLLRFNGGLFQSADALPIDEDQLALLIEAARADWRDVEPAIFGTLLERALDPRDRHKLGAHYTPRAYVERLVMPTVIEPLRDEWQTVKAAAVAHANRGRQAQALKEVKTFHRRLCRVRVLDPACGSGNFLYVTLEHMKRLEGEVLELMAGLGENQYLLELDRHTVDPHQFLGLEINPRAAVITELVLWIGYLQWHFKTRGRTMPAQPVLKDFHNIECRDAVLAYDGKELARDEQGRPITRWDGHTMKTHPTTGEPVPDESARVEVWRYLNPRPAVWPDADFVVGNPPFIGNWRMRGALGEGYVETLRATYPDIPESSDYVMYWWDHAAELTRVGKLQRFGLIATNSLRQTFNRKVVRRHLAARKPLSLVFAIPDHPWVDSADGADVRISMTVGAGGVMPGRLLTVSRETKGGAEHREVTLDARSGLIHADLTLGPDVGRTSPLVANDGLANRGVVLHGAGFIVTQAEAQALGLGKPSGLEKHIRPYLNGRDVNQTPRGVMVIDLFGLRADEVRDRYPKVFQWVYERVKPERDHNKRASRRENWWIFGEPISTFRPALNSVARFIATVETSKHRVFVFLDRAILPDNKLVNIALDDAFFLGVLSSSVHVTWALAAGSRLGIGNDPVYVKTRCFDPFPFPACSESQTARIRALGEALDRHRKQCQAAHPGLTLTAMYNVLEKLRAGEALTDRDKAVHEQGLVSVLRQIHDDLDAAVFDAYGWPADLSGEDILERLVALNRERAEEEKRGLVRWLRPEFQAPTGETAAVTGEAELRPGRKAKVRARKPAWPKGMPAQVQAVRATLAARAAPLGTTEVTRSFSRAKRDRVGDILETLVALGQARITPDGRYAAL